MKRKLKKTAGVILILLTAWFFLFLMVSMPDLLSFFGDWWDSTDSNLYHSVQFFVAGVTFCLIFVAPMGLGVVISDLFDE